MLFQLFYKRNQPALQAVQEWELYHLWFSHLFLTWCTVKTRARYHSSLHDARCFSSITPVNKDGRRSCTDANTDAEIYPWIFMYICVQPMQNQAHGFCCSFAATNMPVYRFSLIFVQQIKLQGNGNVEDSLEEKLCLFLTVRNLFFFYSNEHNKWKTNSDKSQSTVSCYLLLSQWPWLLAELSSH